MGKIKGFFFDLRNFMRYMLYKPFMEIASMFRMLYRGVGELDSPYFWVKFFAFATIFLIIVGNNTKYLVPAYVAAGVMFIAFLRFEWISGRFRKWHTDRLKDRAKKKLEEK